jgi:hypothetical protein
MASIAGEDRHGQGNSPPKVEANRATSSWFCAGYLVVLSFLGLALVRNFDAERIHLP